MATAAGLPAGQQPQYCQLRQAFAEPSDLDLSTGEPKASQASNNNSCADKETASSIGQLGNNIVRRLVAQLTTRKKG